MLPILALMVWRATPGAADTVPDMPPGNTPIPQLEYRVVGKQAHSREHFVQGLEIRDGKLYQGTGIRGKSGVQVFDLASGELLQSRRLSRQLFGEGITVFGDKVFQLTWQSGRVMVYQREDLSLSAEFRIPGQGWGLTNNGRQLIYSDGSDQLHFIDPERWRITNSIKVTRAGAPLRNLNELEWTADYLFANVWRQQLIYLIDPNSGLVVAELDLAGLLPAAERRAGTGVLNGIAVDPDTGLLWVTGKNWPWIYQIELGSTPQKQ